MKDTGPLQNKKKTAVKNENSEKKMGRGYLVGRFVAGGKFPLM